MANMVSYNMGQIRYNTNGNYIQDLNFDDYSIETRSLSNSTSYRDIILYNDNNNFVFSQNESYYLRLGIPRNLSYNMTFDLKLLDKSNNNRNQYQEIKRFVIPRDSSNQITYSKVILYPYDGITEDAEPAVSIIRDSRQAAAINEVYSVGEKFYIKKASVENDIEIQYKNDILLNHT